MNIELDAPITTWYQLTTVLARMNTKLGVIRSVFGADSNVRVMTTYSYSNGVYGVNVSKQFFPLNPNPADRLIVCPDNLCDIDSPDHFSAEQLRELEQNYTRLLTATEPKHLAGEDRNSDGFADDQQNGTDT